MSILVEAESQKAMARHPQDYLDAFNQLLQQTGHAPLKPSPASVFLGLVTGDSYASIAALINRKEVTVRGIATGFWNTLSEAFNVKVTKYNFLNYLDQHSETLCLNLPNASTPPVQSLLERVPCPERFFGRTGDLFDVRQQLECPGITFMVGPTGIGKTALVGTALLGLANLKVIWQTIHDASSLSELWSAIASDEECPESNRLVTELIQKFAESRYVIVIDQAENLLNSSQASALALSPYAQSHKLYGQFFKAVCEKPHQSSLFLLSQQVFPDLQRYYNSGRAVTLRHLMGLSVGDASFLLESCGVPNKEDWGRLIEVYSGNPRLMLQAIAMLEYYGGDIRQFLDHSLFLNDSAREALRRAIRRLGKLEQCILQWLRGDQPIAFPELFDTLRRNGVEVTRNDLFQSVEDMINAAILEKTKDVLPKLMLTASVKIILAQESLVSVLEEPAI